MKEGAFRFRLRLYHGAILVFLFAGFFFAKRILFPAPRPPFELSFWYWHSPFTLTEGQRRDLKKLGVRKLFVRAGTFSSDGTNIVLAIPQRYGGGTQGVPIHLVFNFDSGVIQHFESYDLSRIVPQIASRVDIQVRRAQQAGLEVEGVQFDLDCPTRLLPRYASMVEQIRPKIKSLRKPVISATGLMSWLGTRGVRALSQQVDFLVPQAYEGVTGRTVETMRPVSDEDDFRRRVGRADQLDCPFYVGIPAYGHGFLFDPRGKLVDMFRQLEPGDMLRNPSFNLVSAYVSDREGRPAKSRADSVGEEILKFRAVRPSFNGKGMDDLIGFTLPTVDLPSKMLKAARETQSSNCLGGILYRFSDGESESTIPWPSLMASFEGKSAPPKLKVKLKSTADSFDVIESSKPLADSPKDVNLEIENVGGPTFLSPDAVELDVDLQYPGVDGVRTRDAVLVSAGIRKGERLEFCPESQADSLQFAAPRLNAGEKIRIGPIRLLSSKRQRISVRWKARDADGFNAESGALQVVQ